MNPPPLPANPTEALAELIDRAYHSNLINHFDAHSLHQCLDCINEEANLWRTFEAEQERTPSIAQPKAQPSSRHHG